MSNDGRGRELENAFAVFNQMSEQLETSYRELEGQVAQLHAELAATRGERLRQLQEKERLANRLEKLLDALPAGVVVCDGDGRVQDCNRAAVDLLGEPLLGLSWALVRRRAFEPGQDSYHEILLKNGRRISLTQRSLGCEPGEILLLQDVTETRTMQATIERNERLSAMGEMTASMAHQIRTPLASALLYVSQLGRADLRPADRARFADKVLSRLRHMESQVKDMLIFAKGGRSDSRWLSMEDLLESFRAQAEPLLEGHGARLLLSGESAGGLPANRDALVGALVNLLDNAMQARPEGLELTVEAHCHEGLEWCLRVADNGPGMDHATACQVLDPFFTTRSGGTGLGLAVVQAVVRAHGGRVEFESELGKGTCFRLFLPALEQEQVGVVSRRGSQAG